MNLKKETQRRNSFETGIPVIYYDGKREITGEVIQGKRGHLSISSYEKVKGLEKNIYIPKTWRQVRRFGDKTYEKTHSKKTAMDSHIKKIIMKGGGYKVEGNKITYWF